MPSKGTERRMGSPKKRENRIWYSGTIRKKLETRKMKWEARWKKGVNEGLWEGTRNIKVL